jgi:hypothetical protein
MIINIYRSHFYYIHPTHYPTEEKKIKYLYLLHQILSFYTSIRHPITIYYSI